MGEQMISTGRAGKILGRSRDTVIELMDAGELRGTKPPEKGRHRRIELASVLELRDRWARTAVA